MQNHSDDRDKDRQSDDGAAAMLARGDADERQHQRDRQDCFEEYRTDGGSESIARFDVRQLVRDDSGELVFREQLA